MEDTSDLINLEGENEKRPCEVFILNFNPERSDVKGRTHQAAAIPLHQDHRTRTWLCKYKAIHTNKSLKDPA